MLVWGAFHCNVFICEIKVQNTIFFLQENNLLMKKGLSSGPAVSH